MQSIMELCGGGVGWGGGLGGGVGWGGGLGGGWGGCIAMECLKS